MTRLLLIRHGESNTTVSRVIGGPRTCTGLSPLGRVQSERLRDRLAETGEIVADALYASAYPRAIETAEIIAPALGGLTVTQEPGFGEHDPGPDIDGMSYDDFLASHGMPDWSGDPHAVTFPGGETVADFHHRVGKTLRAILEGHAGETVVVCCHGGVVDAVFRTCLRLRPNGGFSLFTTNTSITELSMVDRLDPSTRLATGSDSGWWRLERYNDAAHLAGL
jgi:probable phosphoglycerate mutase